MNRSDLTNNIPDFIALVEADLRHDEAVSSYRRSTITLNAATVALPSDFREFGSDGSLFFDDGIRQGPIEIVPPESWAAEEGRTGRLTGYPRFATVATDGTELLLSPVPDQAYTAKIVYAIKLPVLSATNASNWILDGHPDLYLYGALKHAAPFLKEDPRVATWGPFYDQAKARLRSFVIRRAAGGNTMRMRPRRAIG